MARQKRRTPRYTPDHYLPDVVDYIKTNGPASTAELAEAVGLGTSGTYALLRRLVEMGELVRDGSRTYTLPTTGGSEPVVMMKRKGVGRRLDEDRRIAQVADLLFDIRKVDLLSFLQWVEMTKELMHGGS